MAIDKKLPLQTSNNANQQGKTIEETYQKKSQLEHILLRPDTYVGSIEKHTQNLWVCDEDVTMVNRSIEFVPGLYKIFDEILVNAADNKQRDPKMNSIKVEIVPEENRISVYNNGNGVPVEIHQEEKVYVPELIFGHLLTSSNYDDAEKKTTGGRNGYGAKLTNIFSTEFIIETADGQRQKKYKQVFSNNMSDRTKPSITKCKESENWTKVTFKPDLVKFKMTELEEDVVALMRKRVVDIAGCLGKTVKVELNGKLVPVKSFEDYCKLYLKTANAERQTNPLVSKKVNDRWEIGFCLSEGQFQQVSFVNSIATIKGGTHVDYVTNQIATYLAEEVSKLLKKEKKNAVAIKPHVVKSHIWIFVNALIDNPAFDSQTKETLTTRQNSFGSTCELKADFLAKVMGTGIVDTIKSWAEFKAGKELKKGDGTKKGRINVDKLDDANDAGKKNAHNCTLILTEGDSAKALAVAGISVVGRNTYGVFPLRGKLLNVREASHKQITENNEITEIKRILGLQHGKVYTDVKSLRYGSLMIMTDQDHDGSHIKGLLINFIHSFWPELLKIKSFLVEFITPIVKATRKGEATKSFYSMPEYESWKESLGGNACGWKIKYYKGLGTSTPEEGKEYFKALNSHKKEFCWEDDQDGEAIEMAFSKKKIEARKNWLRNFEPGTFLDQRERNIKYSDFVNKELILFSLADLQRSIPSMVDGFKPGQRKILFSSLKRNFVQEAKVAQFSGYVSEHSAYHHGEQSLQSTIVGMAQHFVGSNNINLLEPKGQFGSRAQGGKDAASARYIFTKLSPVTRALFHKDDDVLLQYLNEDGQSIEPFWYAPIIPMVLVNGSEGIGTGWSSYVPNYNPKDIILNIRRLLKGEAMEPMHPWYRGFKGTIEKTATKEGGYTISGIIEEDETEPKFTIVELPIRKWINDYRKYLDTLVDANDIEEFINHSDEATPYFVVTMTEEKMKLAKQEGLLKKFKLTTSISMNNMHLFDPKGIIKKYGSAEEILEEFFHLRLEMYAERKKVMVENLEQELLKLNNKVRFIHEVITGELIVSNRKKMDLFHELRQKGYTPFPKKLKNDGVVIAGAIDQVDEAVGDPEDDTDESMEVTERRKDVKKEVSGGVPNSDYDYLLSLSIGTLTLEKKNELIGERDKTVGEMEALKKTPHTQLWLNDLDGLDKELEKQQKRDDNEEKKRLEHRMANLKKQAAGAGNSKPKKTTKNTKKSSTTVSKADAAPDTSTTETEDTIITDVKPKPKARGGPRKPAVKKGKAAVEKESDEILEEEVLALKDRLAAQSLADSSPEPSAAMDMETIPEEEMVENLDSDEEFVAVTKAAKKKGGGGRKPAAPKVAAAPARKRGPAAKKVVTEETIPSPDKKMRKLRPSPFNKKSSSVLGRLGAGVSSEDGGGGSASASDGGSGEAFVAKARPQRARATKMTYVLSDSEESEEAESENDSDDVFEIDD